uniref:putative monothiol glutaredoxin ycf64 like n=1 Tax=Caulacanthus ustulatus TaxID=31411 RepID=UPI0027DA4DC6|nr:putative monothiol glutaredoxin ycf64 like [Caulacanthus ustulatus]WCH57268.1 putative monothiol glutaredoxin ycf64 like [Caulacanthus ustulatus]
MSNQCNNEIENLIYNHKIIAFVKGSKSKPMCGFSNTVIQILNKFNIDYHTVDILTNNKIRNGIKEYSQWPTIPQVYINKKFIGGADILLDLYNTYKLHEILEKSINS